MNTLKINGSVPERTSPFFISYYLSDTVIVNEALCAADIPHYTGASSGLPTDSHVFNWHQNNCSVHNTCERRLKCRFFMS